MSDEPLIARLLDVAAADGRPEELDGHGRAVSAFRAAHRRPRERLFKRPLLAALAALTLLGGAGMAAAAGDLPGTGRESAPRTPAPSPTPVLRHKTAPPIPPAAAPVVPARPSRADLCRAAFEDRRGQAYRALVKAAGGERNLGRYCGVQDRHRYDRHRHRHRDGHRWPPR